MFISYIIIQKYFEKVHSLLFIYLIIINIHANEPQINHNKICKL